MNIKRCAMAALLAVLSAGGPGRADGFDDARLAAEKQNPAGLIFALRTADGRKRFHQGETIRVTLSFAAVRPGLRLNTFIGGRPGLTAFGTFQAASAAGLSDGAVDPLRELPPPLGFAYEGPPPPAPVKLGATPYELSFNLNEWLRFDRPGMYRVYASATRVFEETNKPAQALGPFFPPGVMPAVSNALELEVVPADDVWLKAQWPGALKQLSAGTTRGYGLPLERDAPTVEADARFLDTPAATQAIIERMGQGVAPRSSMDETWAWQPALIGRRDRAGTVVLMERSMVRRDYAVTQGFLDTLALLRALPRAPRRAGDDITVISRRRKIESERQAFISEEWTRAAASVGIKTSSARALTLHTLLETAWSNAELAKNPGVVKCLPQLKLQLVPVFDALPELPLKYFLGSEWPQVGSPQLLPALLRLWNRPPGAEAWPPEEHSLVLRRIREIAPDTGRRLIVEEIRHPAHAIDASTLGLLPDKTLPALDAILAARLERAKVADEKFETTCALIERYASASIAQRVRQIYTAQDDWSCAPQSAMLAYLLRTDPDRGAALIEKALMRRARTRCYRNLLTEIARLHPDRRLFRIARNHLQDPDGWVVDNARYLLRSAGKLNGRGVDTRN